MTVPLAALHPSHLRTLKTDQVRAGQTWYGWQHGSVWMAFAGHTGLFDLWCSDPRCAPIWRHGSILADRTAAQVLECFDPDPPHPADLRHTCFAVVDTTALRSWTTIPSPLPRTERIPL